VLETLSPAERLAFVLHDMFAVPFDEIDPIVSRSSTAADSSRAGLAASRDGDFEALLAVLDPDDVLHVDSSAVPTGVSNTVRGARTVVKQALTFSRLARFARPALVNGAAGVVTASEDKTYAVMACTIVREKVVKIGILADPVRLRRLDLVVLDA
jgi:ketosteroid isomerase-like protein